ncbi:hypothetical protein PHYC_03263 [Phycisphaerales bacterium]|nr:hypothetical protein PHYC_03263 [Phycisphaerales bacterium]
MHERATSPEGAGLAPGDEAAAALIDRMRRGDREATGTFLSRYGGVVRQRCRKNLRAPLRKLTDTEELWSSVARRLDAVVAAGDLRAVSESQFWKLLKVIIRNATVDRARLITRLHEVPADDQPLAEALGRHVMHDREAESRLWHLIESLPDDKNREITILWLNGHSHAEIGNAVGLAEGAVRFRWHSIRQQLRDVLESEAAA